MTRRSLIQRALLLLGVDAIGLSGCASHPLAAGASAPAKVVSASTSASGTLSTADIDDVVALGEALVEGRTLSAGERQQLVEHLQVRTARSREYLSFYRTTASVLEHLAGRRFASLALRERLAIISRHRLASPRIRPSEDLGEFPAELRTLRTRTVPDLISGYYGSPAGWGVVDYQTFPGRCGDLTRYTRAEP